MIPDPSSAMSREPGSARAPLHFVPLYAQVIPPHAAAFLQEESEARGSQSATRTSAGEGGSSLPEHVMALWREREARAWPCVGERPLQERESRASQSHDWSVAEPAFLVCNPGGNHPAYDPGEGTTRVALLPVYRPSTEERARRESRYCLSEMKEVLELLLIYLQRLEWVARYGARSSEQNWLAMISQACQRLVQQLLEGTPPRGERDPPHRGTGDSLRGAASSRA